MRSLTRSSTKDAATLLRAVKRFGFKSCANILEEISIAITISIPLLVLVRVETSMVWGRAKAITISTRDKILKTNNSGCNRDKKLDLDRKPAREEIFKTACDFFRVKKNLRRLKTKELKEN